jgi:hypothetical protein
MADSRDSEQAVTMPADAMNARRWYWPLRPVTWVAAGIVALFAIFANYPPIIEPYVDLNRGSFDPEFSIGHELVHGWPLRYVRRTIHLAAEPSWQPWDDVRSFQATHLFLDLGLWILAIVAAAYAAQYWRWQRQKVWQLGIRDLLGLMVLAGIALAWIVYQRDDSRKEARILADYRQRTGISQQNHTRDAAYRAWLPHHQEAVYLREMRRVLYFYSQGDTDLACELRHVVVLRETTFHRDFRQHLRQMPGLLAIDLSNARLPYFDVTRQATLLRDLPAMPNLRGINLYGTNVTDADLAWLAKCPQLEVINLSATSISDRGLRQLAELPRLRRLAVDSSRITDAGCQTLASFPALEELELGSRNIHDAGVAELEVLPHLQLLKISAPTASDAAWAHFRAARPGCQLRAGGR